MGLMTRILSPHQVEEAAQLLVQGECVAFPTETVYGLGANAMDPQAVAKIFAAKRRPGDNPLIVHIYHLEQLADLAADYTEAAMALMQQFWPGPLSLILPRSPNVPKIVTGGLDSVAIRMPDHSLALDLFRRANLPVAAPSANLSGRPSPTRAAHVYQDLQGAIPAILDGGPTGWGLESTVVDCTRQPFRILRPGGITLEQLNQVVPVEIDPGLNQETKDTPRSPGMKYKHYSPRAQIILVVGDNITPTINRLAQDKDYATSKLGVMTASETKANYPGLTVLDLGSRQDYKMVASRLYHLLRLADDLHLDTVFVEGFPDTDLGMAIMNRLRKAAGSKIVHT